MSRTHELVKFRLYVMQCCSHALCWINPRPPTFCPCCGKMCYPDVKQWAHVVDDEAVLQLDAGVVP